SQLTQSFCRVARQIFHASGAYFWTRTPEGDLIGAEANGFEAERFRGLRLQVGDSSIAMEAMQKGRTVFLNDVDMSRYPQLAEFRAESVMAAPVAVSGEVIGAITVVQDEVGSRFDENSAAKATILAAQFGTALEALRLNL